MFRTGSTHNILQTSVTTHPFQNLNHRKLIHILFIIILFLLIGYSALEQLLSKVIITQGALYFHRNFTENFYSKYLCCVTGT